MALISRAVKKAWTQALLSGEYGQCKGKLTDGNGNYCCLGVLFDQLGITEVNRAPLKDNDSLLITGPVFSCLGGTGGAQGMLAKMNDTGKTFKEIAKVINKL